MNQGKVGCSENDFLFLIYMYIFNSTAKYIYFYRANQSKKLYASHHPDNLIKYK